MRYNPLETVPVTGCVNPEVLASDISRDFPLTFKFSQGDTGLQRNLSHLVAATYVHVYTPEDFSEALPDALAQADAATARVRPPRNHTPFEDEAIQKEGAKQWERFTNILTERSLKGEMSSYRYWARVRYLNYIIPVQDAKFTLHGRVQHEYSGRKYDSYYRRYIMEEQQTASLPFNVIFSAMRYGFMRHTQLIPFLGVLKTAWEYHHPGESFVPDAFREELKTSGSWYGQRAIDMPWPGSWFAKKILPGLTEVAVRNDVKSAEKYRRDEDR
jgi:hypothetical protein